MMGKRKRLFKKKGMNLMTKRRLNARLDDD